MNNIKVSVCISVHNTAKYLPRCLDSVCAQTLDELEIVLVNNDSTDNSEDIMYEYQKRNINRRIIIVRQEDKGLAQGRQTGINNATGEYIGFLDADDFIDATMYETMYRTAINENVDIVEVETRRDTKVLSSPFNGKVSAHDVLNAYFRGASIQPMLWLRIYKRELFQKPVLPELYTNNEDNFALPCLLFAAKDVYFLKKVLHTYSTDNENAVMTLIMDNPQNVHKRYVGRMRILYAMPHFENFIKDKPNKDIIDIFRVYKAKLAASFILTNFKNVDYDTKVKDIVNAYGLKKETELRKYLYKYLPVQLNFYSIVKFLGPRIGHLVSCSRQ